MARGPFYIGQPVDHVLYVAKRTGRKRQMVKVLNEDEVKGEDGKLNLKDVAEKGIVRYWYPDVVLTFQLGRDPKGEGATCFRITEIEWRGADG